MLRRVFFVAAVFAVAAAARAQLNDTEGKTIANDTQPAATSTVVHPALPPKWAFGVLFGSYMDQDQLLATEQRLRKDYCGDLLWIDSSWLSGQYTDKAQNHYINFTFDPVQFPDPKGMIAQLRQDHFHFGVWEWPFVDKSITDLYSKGEKEHLFVTDQKGGGGAVVSGGGWHGVKFTGQFDFTNPKAVDWFVELNKPLTDMGLDFLKIDTYSTVPKNGATFDGSGSDILRQGFHKAAYAVSQGGDPTKRGFILAHTNDTPDNLAYPGMWTGDVKTTWAGFEGDMKTASTLDTPGTAAYWGSDTGGYNGDVQGDELYIRWLQYTTFTPINEFFCSKGNKGRFPWIFGEDAQRNFNFYTALRYRLLPFRYSNAQMAYHESPVKYPVHFFEGTTDEIILGGGDSRMLVAPIHVQGATSRDVSFPDEGKNWINYWTGEEKESWLVATVDAPLDRIPIFVEAGSIIPMGPDMHYVDEKIADPMTLDIYPYGTTHYTLYEDDGVTTDYQKDKFTKTLFTCSETPTGVNLTISPVTGDYTGKIAKRTYILQIHSAKKYSASREGNAVATRQTKDALDAADDGTFSDGKIVWVKFTIGTDKGTSVVLTAQ